MMRSPSDTKIETTLGELIAIVSETALETVDNTQEAYVIAAAVIADLLNNNFGDSFARGNSCYLH